MPIANITSVTVLFGNGIKKEDFGPVKKAEVSLTAAVGDDEDGAVILHSLRHLATCQVAEMLSAPRPDTVASASIEAANAGEPPARRTRRTAAQIAADEAAKASEGEAKTPSGDAEPAQTQQSAGTEDTASAGDDEWASGPADIEVTDAELLAATSKRAGELGARDPIVKLIATFATRTEGAPFKVQEIPQEQRKDYIAKLSALTA